ncbi:MAG: DUF2231 domain-containing protein [Acidobacteriota bacterium]
MVPHTIVVDFAVALLITSFTCDLLAVTVEEAELGVVAWWTLLFGTLAAGFAVISGFVAASSAPDRLEVASTILSHRNLGIVTLVCFATCLGWRGARQGALPRRYRGIYWLLAATGTATLMVTAYYGGILVFRLGVGVAPHS